VPRQDDHHDHDAANDNDDDPGEQHDLVELDHEHLVDHGPDVDDDGSRVDHHLDHRARNDHVDHELDDRPDDDHHEHDAGHLLAAGLQRPWPVYVGNMRRWDLSVRSGDGRRVRHDHGRRHAEPG